MAHINGWLMVVYRQHNSRALYTSLPYQLPMVVDLMCTPVFCARRYSVITVIFSLRAATEAPPRALFQLHYHRQYQ